MAEDAAVTIDEIRARAFEMAEDRATDKEIAAALGISKATARDLRRQAATLAYRDTGKFPSWCYGHVPRAVSDSFHRMIGRKS